MADLKQSFQNLRTKMLSNVPRLFLSAMGLVLLIRLLIYSAESDFTISSPQQPIIWKPKDTLKPEVKKKVLALTTRMPEFKKGLDRYQLAEQNMFDPQLVLEASDLKRQAKNKIEQAEKAYFAQEYQRAHTLLKEALAFSPNHLRGNNLLSEIEKELGISRSTPTGEQTPTEGVEEGAGDTPPPAPTPTPPAP